MKLCWISDTHLDFPSEDVRKNFYDEITNSRSDCVILTGDIADGRTVDSRLEELIHYCNMSVYFVLGNHDFFHSSIELTRSKVSNLCAKQSKLIWMNEVDSIALDPSTVLVGIDGWADGRYGDYQNSRIKLLDSRYIDEYITAEEKGRSELLKTMQQFSDQDAVLLDKKLHQVKNIQTIIVLTHIPPFPDCSWHNDEPSSKESLPFFSSKATGDVLLRFSGENPHINLHVYCGHSHCYRKFQPLENLLIETAYAKTGEPAIADIINI